MRIGWLADNVGTIGGAELTEREFREAAPDGVEVIPCPRGAVVGGLDRYVIQNCLTYDQADIAAADGPWIKYWNDIGRWMNEDIRKQIEKTAVQVFCSPLQAEYMGCEDVICIPPPVNLQRFSEAAENVNGSRRGVVSVSAWRSLGKGAHQVSEWARRNGVDIDFYGAGVLAPPNSHPIAYRAMPALLANYETFVFLPTVIEPFARVVAEAWAAGCEVVTNDLVGAKWWITEKPEAIETAAEDFWKVVLS